jgi:galactose mutarotase-like enzyme
MSFSHREEKRGERLLDVLTDEAASIRIVVSRLGAELVSLARRDKMGRWVGFLYRDGELDAPDKGWANHATVMGYFLHRLKDGRSVYRGHRIEGGTHSFLRAKDWRRNEVAAGEGKVTYRIDRRDFTPAEYPLDVSLALSYALEGEAVRVSFHFQNHEPELTAHVGFGLHPGVAATSFESFRFEMPAGHYRRHFSPTNYLSGETEDIRFAGGEMPFPREKLPGSYILELVDVPERTFTYSDPPSGRRVSIDLTSVPYLTLWSDGGPFLCVEPCWGLTDHEQQRAFEDKEGIQAIAAGGELHASFTMEPRITSNA